ncbi:proline-rich receptor-like protein kinase PERK4 [Lolium perenne]|uniref:proline-rich receptor-like protein kinase PERK4 n=1 Tax=Lolium perenne TaxID=4522 RepID=UPI0021F50997|nr:putative proline-rich receptor-like protein kinase PERK6 [Lolium perenne]
MHAMAFDPSPMDAASQPSTSHVSPPWTRASRRLSSHGGRGSGGDLMSEQAVLAAVGAALLLFAACCCCCCCGCCRSKKKAKQQPYHDAMRFYAETSGFKGDSTATYYTSGVKPAQGRQQWQNQVAASSSANWRVVPAPPPPDMDSTVFSTHRPPVMPPPPPPVPVGIEKNAFSYEELAAATGGFSEANLLGQGGFGYVHRGVLPGGKEVAVKQLKAGSGQGEREFQAEVDMISRVHHRHLVSLVGYCIAGARRLLVYDFVPNQTLEHHLHGKGLPAMEWTTRLRIAVGSAKGVAYLHEDCNPRIIHRDIKSANILLDSNFEAMVADFGLAKLSHGNDTHVSTRVMGTFGYLAPEYASSGKLTEKSDVFSYGVMLVELLTGRRPADRASYGAEDCLVDWARPALSSALADGDYDGLVDERLDGDYDQMEAARVVACAAACIRHTARRRPKMSQVVKALQGEVPLETLNDAARGATLSSVSSMPGPEYGQSGSSSYTVQMERIRKVALPSPEYSAEYAGPISGFGHPSPSPGSSVDSNVSPAGEHVPVTNQRHRGYRQV